MKIAYLDEAGNLVLVHPVAPVEEVLERDIPRGVEVTLLEDNSITAPRELRAAWSLQEGTLGVDMEKAKSYLHAVRRRKRDLEFSPLDRLATIPGKIVEAEMGREKIRQDYAALQTAIDVAENPEELLSVLREIQTRA